MAAGHGHLAADGWPQDSGWRGNFSPGTPGTPQETRHHSMVGMDSEWMIWMLKNADLNREYHEMS